MAYFWAISTSIFFSKTENLWHGQPVGNISFAAKFGTVTPKQTRLFPNLIQKGIENTDVV